MDPKASLSSLLAAASGDPTMIANSPLGSLAFSVGAQPPSSDLSNTYNQPKSSFTINPLQLTAALAAANIRLDNQQFTATSPPNNFIAASPLSSISSLSSITTEASPTPFTSLSALSPSNLQQLSRLITPGLDVTQTSVSESADMFNKIRGALAQSFGSSSSGQMMSNAHSPLYNSSAMISNTQSNCSPGSQMSTTPTMSTFDHDDGSTSNGTRRIRRRRPKSPKTPAKRTNSIVEIKQEHSMNPIDEPMSDSPPIDNMVGASDPYANMGDNPLEPLSEEEQSRRQKLCRVCGDQATGYNFNVISCESCKAFFRRNALRPKDFKCPYSGECEINAVSRRFCQKCRLAKCFRAGMKKEWILNDEQLKRRKNSRLHSLRSVGSNASMDPISPPLQQIGRPEPLLHSPLPPLPAMLSRTQSIDESMIKREPIEQPMSNQLPITQHQLINQQQQPTFMNPLQMGDLRLLPENGNNAAIQQLLTSAANQQQQQGFLPLLSQYGRMPQITPGQPLTPMMAQQQIKSPIEKSMEQPRFETPVSTVADNNQVRLQQMNGVAMEEYNQFLQNATTQPSPASYQPNTQTQFNLSPTTNASLNPMNGTPMGVENNQMPANPVPNYDPVNMQNMGGNVGGSPVDSPQQSSSQMSSPNASMMFPPFFDWSPATFRQMEESIQDEFESCSPGEFVHELPNSINFKETIYGDALTNYNLNASELCELDVVRNAYTCMEEPLHDSKDSETLKKKEHNPADVMNIIDIIMRRFVKMTKKLPAFNTLSQDAKLCLLKTAMIKMVTMRGATRFDPKKLCWNSTITGRTSTVSCQIFDKLNDSCQKSNFIRFCYNINDVIRSNGIVINLVGLLILFDNTDSIKNEKDKQLIQKYYSLYSNLLRRYVESVFGHESGPIVDSIPRTLDELNRISTIAETIFVGRVKADETRRRLAGEFFKTQVDDISTQALTPSQPTTSA